MNKMKKIISLLLIATMMVSLAACGTDSSSSKESNTDTSANGLPSYKFQLGYNTVEESVRGEMAKAFKEYVETTSDGRIEIQLFPAGTLGTEPEMTEMVKIGTLDFTLPGISNMSTVDPSFSSVSLPFLVKDFDEAHTILDGELGDKLKEIAQNYGYKILSFGDLGMAQITNNKRPINSLADMSGLKMRSPNEEASIKTFESLGSSVTTLAFSELYLAMSQGVVDGQFNPIDAIYQQKFYEVQDYLAVTNIFYYGINFIMNNDKFESYDAETQQIILDGTAKAQEVAREYAADADAEFLELMKDGFKEITNPDTKEFMEAVQPVYDNFAETANPEVMEIINNLR